MKLSKLLNTTTKKIVAVLVIMALIGLAILFAADPETGFALLRPLMYAILVVCLAWLAIHFGMKAWRKRKRDEFDEKVAAKEGIDDRKREWNTWTDELDKQGIDRYELPFYLLVGEPQSGKSVLLHNSDLHFPFGQNRLSGVGGTRGCDWWFTDEAVILDMAGRLFTHEGGAADRLEFEAFLQLLFEFRPLVPANGVILVIPCDSLLQDTPEECADKANKIQSALMTLTTKLQAQLPVYLVLTKGDQIFGFAETVHRLDVEQRHQMFGWSRPADRIDSPFDLTEVLQGFDVMVQRSRLLRAHMMAGARLPEATPEIDRMTAFPHELEGLRPNLEAYLKRIFTASNLTDRVFFRGVYLTSGLQTGVPIAKVSSDLFGAPGEADMRDLEALFQKQRAYFIKDLVRNRVFGERGLVRPTEGRVNQARKTSAIGYGVAGTILGISIITSAFYLLRETDTRVYDVALEETTAGLAAPVPVDPLDHTRSLLYQLQCVADAAQSEEGRMEQTFSGAHAEFERLFCAVFDNQLLPRVKEMVLVGIRDGFRNGLKDFEDLDAKCKALSAVAGGADFSSKGDRTNMLLCVPGVSSIRATREGQEPLSLRNAFKLRDDFGDGDGMFLALEPGEDELVNQLLVTAVQAIEDCVTPSSNLRPRDELGYMLAWYGAEQASKRLKQASQDGKAIRAARDFAATVDDMELIRKVLPGGAAGREISFGAVMPMVIRLNKSFRARFVDLLTARSVPHDFPQYWSDLTDVTEFVDRQMKEFAEGPKFSLSNLGLHFGSDDAGRTLFMMTEGAAATAQGKIVIQNDGFNPVDVLDEPKGMVRLCRAALPVELGGGALKGLAATLAMIKDDTLGSGSRVDLENIFKAECSEMGQKFAEEITTPAELRDAFLGSEAEGASPLPQVLVTELVDLHLMVARLLTEYEWGGGPERSLRELQVALERHLSTLLTGAGSPEAWMPPLTSTGELTVQAWDYLAALRRITDLEQENPRNYKIKDGALTLLERGFLLRADELLERWRRRDADDLDLTDQTVDELRKLAVGVQENIQTGTMAGADFARWSRQVDTLLEARLGNVEDEIHALWRAGISMSGSLKVAVGEAKKELGEIGVRIDQSEAQGMAAISDILLKLEPNGAILSWLTPERSQEVLAGLQDWSIPKNAAHVEAHPEYGNLWDALSELDDRTSDPEFLTRQFRRNWMDYSREGASSVDAGVRLVREIREVMTHRMERAIQEQYLQKLEDLFDKRDYEDLLDVVFWEPGDELPEVDNADIERALDDLFKERRGDFSELLDEFGMIGEDSISLRIFPKEPDEDEDVWAQYHRFLIDLRTFLLEGDESEQRRSIEAARIDFWLEPDVKTGSLWDLQTIDPSEQRAWFYYPADDSASSMDKLPLSALREVSVMGWSFDSRSKDRSLRLVWSRPSVWDDARGDPSNASFEVPTSLAPLLLAWHGSPLYDDNTEFMIALRPSGTKLAADIKVRFKSGIPLRPEERP